MVSELQPENKGYVSFSCSQNNISVALQIFKIPYWWLNGAPGLRRKQNEGIDSPSAMAFRKFDNELVVHVKVTRVFCK